MRTLRCSHSLLSLGLLIIAKGVSGAELAAPTDPLKEAGNAKPRIVRFSAEQESAILKDVVVPEGFEVTLFANSAAANYPVFVAAAPNGDLYVSSDGNGSLGRQPHRGRIIRLRDTDGDGRADVATEFVPDLDSPRGLVWDHDRLYVVHPPDVSVFFDRDGDGVAEEKKTLIKGIAFGFADRPADHTTNGLSLGIDGWLYAAGGDFGFLNAVGTDGRQVQHRGGGVIRFRPDGSGLEVFSRGTRNIVEVAVGPRMELFARDNTNDGGGWDIRFEHFTGWEHHGYPSLYKNFGGEHVAPVADYGGGSGCGALFLDEPGFGPWNGPLTADWGTGALWHHAVVPSGSSFRETAPPRKFIAVTRPTDADVDAMGHIYQASWKGATFNWAGTDVGYIARVTPKGWRSPLLPEFARLGAKELVALLASPSHRTRLEAQRTLLRQPESAEITEGLLALAGDRGQPLVSRIAAVYGLTQRAFGGVVEAAVGGLASDPALQPHVLRALGDVKQVRSSEGVPQSLGPTLAAGLKSPDAAARLAAIISVVHQRVENLAPLVAGLLGDADDRVAHTAARGLGALGLEESCFAVIDDPTSSERQQLGAARALQLMHRPAVVDGVLARLGKLTDSSRRQNLLRVLCRLHFQEGTWKGDSWGTRPDTLGPYYQPEEWSETPRVAAAIKQLLAAAAPAEASFLVQEMNRNRIKSTEALDRIIALANSDPALAADAVTQIAAAEDVPANGLPLLLRVAENPDARPAILAQALMALSKISSSDGARAMLSALAALDRAKGSGKEQEAGRSAFLNSAKLDVVHEVFEQEATRIGSPGALWADAALLKIKGNLNASPEARDAVVRAVRTGWENPKRRVQIIRAAERIRSRALDEEILAARDDSDPDVARAAKAAATALRLNRAPRDRGPAVGTLKLDDVVAQVVQTKGDVALGEQLFTKQTCASCHTVSQGEAPKGPYLGNIAQTYNRRELAQNILEPGRTIAQGFATEVIRLKNGDQQVGFITLESAETVKMRNVAAQEFAFATKDVAERQKLPISVMPPGLVDQLTVREFASLLDYLESLSPK